MMVNAQSNLVVTSLQISTSRLLRTIVSWDAGDCFLFEMGSITEYDVYGIEWNPVLEDLSCPDLEIGGVAGAAECEYVSDRQFRITMLAGGDNAEGLIGPFQNPPSLVSNVKFSSILYFRGCSGSGLFDY